MKHITAPFVRTAGRNGDVDPGVTRIPFEADAMEESPFYDGADVRLFVLASPIYGMGGEVATHLFVSVASREESLARGGDGTPSVLVLAGTETEPFSFPAAPPLACVAETDDVAAVLVAMGFVDLTDAE